MKIKQYKRVGGDNLFEKGHQSRSINEIKNLEKNQ